MKENYQQICQALLKVLPEKQKEVISRRFGLNNGSKETLEAIGKDMSVTRERVRQIERDGFLRLEPEKDRYKKIFQEFSQYLKKKGGYAKEESIISEFGESFRNQIVFLLSLEGEIRRFSESNEFYPFWAKSEEQFNLLKKNVALIKSFLKKKGQPLKLKDLKKEVPSFDLESVLEISKEICSNSEGLYGLSEWPEVNPKRIKDKAYIVLKKEKKPLHFNDVANLIPAALPQTVHNELIKDSRFVLVGRGIYALDEWGYEKGVIKDVIAKVLKDSKKPLSKEEIIKTVLNQRLVKENTVLLNLSNRKYFKKDSGGFYTFQTS